MAKVTYTILDENLNNIPENEVLSEKDLNLIDNYQINKKFNFDSNYIEGHIYSLSNFLLYSDYGVNIPIDIESSEDTETSSIYFDPATFTANSGFEFSSTKAVFHFLDDVYSISKNSVEFYIDSISQDRTEVLLYTDKITENKLINNTEALKENFKINAYYDELYLNLGNNDLLIITNIDVFEKEDKYTVALKLYEPLPAKYNLKSAGNVVEKKSDSIAVLVNVDIEEEPIPVPKLRQANFDLELDDNTITPTEYFNYDTLFSFSNTNSNREIYSYLNEKSIKLNIDHSDYSNFINFSSAQERLKNFKYKVQLIESYQNSIDSLSNISEGSSQTSGSTVYYEKLIEGIVENFDHYEDFLYFESGSSSWPKSTTTKPHINLNSSNSAVDTWYSNQLTTASNYDTSNYKVLSNTIPSFLSEDSSNESAVLFVHMIGQHFDNLWIYTKAVTEKYNNDNRVDVGISKELIKETIQSFGTKVYDSVEGSNDLFKYLIADTYDSGSSEEVVNTFTQVPGISSDLQPVSRKNYESEVYKRIYHNLPFLMKTKGTERGLRALINCFGIPSDFLTIKQYGGDTIGSSKFFGYENEVTSSIDKVRYETRASGSVGFVLTKDKSIQKKEVDRTQDIHRLEIGFSPSDSINNYIISQLPTTFNIDDYIGDPRDSNQSSYVNLIKEAERVLLSSTERAQLNDFVRIFKFYDNVLFKMVKDFIPAKGTLDTGIIIKPHLLNRSKAKTPDMSGTRPEYTGSIDTAFTSGSQSGVYDKTSVVYTTSHSIDIATMTGSVVKPITDDSPMFNGELSGSTIEVTDGELNKANIFKQVNVPFISYDIIARDAGSGADYTAFQLATTSTTNTDGSEVACSTNPSLTTAYHNGAGNIPQVGDYIFDGINDATGKNGGGNWWIAYDVQGDGSTYALRVSGSGAKVGFVGNVVNCSTYDSTPPSGYTATWNMVPQNILENNQSAAAFRIFNAEVGATYAATASLEASPGTKVYKTGTITGTGTTTDFTSTINCTGLADGANVLLDVTLTDTAGNVGGFAPVGSAPANTLTASLKDTSTPSGYSARFTTSNYSTNTSLVQSSFFYFTVENLPSSDSGTLYYTLTSTGGGTYSNSISWNTTFNTTRNVSVNTGTSLNAGTVTLTVYAKDTAGNQGANVTDTATYSPISGTMTTSANTTNLGYWGQTFSFSVNVTPDTGQWYITDTASWISVSGASGNGDDSFVTAAISQNYGSSPRIGTIYLKAAGSGTTLDSIPIMQNQNCVAPHTLILMGDGTLKKAGDLQVGDVVKTKHETTLEDTLASIIEKKLYINDRIKVTIGDKEIICSPKHRFYVDNKADFIHADELEDGDILSGKEFISREEHEPGHVVKLTVENAATYISEEILSHNIK